MATVAARPESPAVRTSSLPGRQYDHLFFATMALIMLVMTVVGFGPTYYFAGVFRAPLPSTIIHIHGAVFSLWILLLVTQTSLVSAGRADIHRRLGIAGFVLACAMVVLGTMAATDSLVHERGPAGRDTQFFYIVPMSNMVIFAVLMFFAFRNRFTPAAHKRIIYVATASLLLAAVARWPIVNRNLMLGSFIIYSLLLIMMAYDYWALRKVHRATLWASVFVVLVFVARIPIGKSAAWHSFAAWVQHVAR